MKYTKEQILKAAEECGIKVEFNSPNVGYSFGDEHYTPEEFSKYIRELFVVEKEGN